MDEIVQHEAVRSHLLGSHIQVLVNGCVQFNQVVDRIDCTTVFHASDDPPCEVQFCARYGKRRPDGGIEV